MGLKLQIFLFFFGSWSYSQESGLEFKNITIDHGLSQNSVVDIAQDELGFMWFATQDGLNRYDGQDFKIFPEVFDDITSPAYSQLGELLTSEKKLWFISRGGKLKVMDLSTEDIFSVEKLGAGMDLLPPVSTIFKDENNNLWIGTLENGLFQWDMDDNSFSNYTETGEFPFTLAGNEVRSIFKDHNGKIWILTNNGVSKIGIERTLTFLQGVNTNVLTQDREGRLWLGTFGEGLYKKERSAGKFERVKEFGRDTLPQNLVIEAIHADAAGNIWIGTYGNGLFVLNKEHRKILHALPERGNPFSIGFQDILSIKEDKEGAIWIGTDGGGVSYYNPHFNIFRRLTGQDVSEEISIRQIRAITTEEDGGIWLGTSGNGLTYLSADLKNKRTFHLKPHSPGIANYDRIVSLFIDDEGDLWIGTQGNGLLVKDRETGKIKKWFFSSAKDPEESIPDNTIWSMLEAGPQRVFAATRNAGVLLIDKNTGLVKSYPSLKDNTGSPAKKNIRSMSRVNDSILALGTERNAIYLLNTCRGSFKKLTNRVIEETLGNEYGIKSLYYSDGYLWAGTAGRGLLITHLKSGKTTSIRSAQGLPNEMIYGIIPEGKNYLWMSSNKGLFRLNYRIADNVVRINHIKSYTVGDGLQSNEFNTGAYHRSKGGTIFFGGIHGLNFFDPEDILHEKENKAVVLTGAMVDNNPLQTDSTITYKKSIKLPYSRNSVSFNYTVLDYLSPETMNYEYMLEGYDEQWIHAGNRKYSAYTNLSPGDYIFKVKPAGNVVPDGTPATLGISISAPFWLEWWFFILIFLLISGALYLFYKYRINQIMEVQRVKNNISAELHDDIGSRLTSIQFLSALSRKKWVSRDDAGSCLEGIEEEVQASSEALNEIVWNIRMDDESLEDIVAKMRRYTGEALDSTDIRYSVDIDGNFSGRKMEMQKRREIFLIFKELLNNVRKHAAASQVEIKISSPENMFFLAVKDDGRGFDPSGETFRNGIRNVRERIEKWNGTLRISSEPGQGSLIEIGIPFDRTTILSRIFGTL